MQKPEGKWRQEFVKKMRSLGALAQPIESGSTALGIPDVYFCIDGLCVWVELKAMPEVSIEAERKIPYRPLQYRWGIENESRGGISLTGVRYSDGVMFIHTKDVDSTTMRPVKQSALYQRNFVPEGLIRWLKAVGDDK